MAKSREAAELWHACSGHLIQQSRPACPAGRRGPQLALLQAKGAPTLTRSITQLTARTLNSQLQARARGSEIAFSERSALDGSQHEVRALAARHAASTRLEAWRRCSADLQHAAVCYESFALLLSWNGSGEAKATSAPRETGLERHSSKHPLSLFSW